MKKFFIELWKCYILRWHEWTSPIERGEKLILPPISATKKQFQIHLYESSKMTCRYCGVEAEPSKRMYNRIMNEN